MSKVLYIKANPKTDTESRTFRISESFIKEYRNHHPKDEIMTLDLYKEKVTPLTAETITLVKPVRSDLVDKNNPISKYAYQFYEADKYVFAEPLWNLGIPSILKAYMDYITVAGITFAYTVEGPKGLCINKKAINITARGGTYSTGDMAAYEMGDRYLRTILAFVGICEVKTIAAESLDIIGSDVEGIVSKAIQEAKEAAKSF